MRMSRAQRMAKQFRKSWAAGMARQANQNFKLKQAPALTYTRSTAPGGMESSLQIRVNDLLWHEVPTLFGRGSRERVFTTEHGGRRLGHGALW